MSRSTLDLVDGRNWRGTHSDYRMGGWLGQDGTACSWIPICSIHGCTRNRQMNRNTSEMGVGMN